MKARRLLLAAAVVVTGCFAAQDAPLPGEYDLLSERNGPLLLVDSTTLVPGDGAFGAGFHAPESYPGDPTFAWMSAQGVIEIDLAGPRARRVVLDVQSFHRSRQVRVHLAERQHVVEVAPGWQRLELPLPEGEIAPGRYALRLQATAERPSDVLASSSDTRSLSIAIRSVRIEPPPSSPPEVALGTARGLRLSPGTAAVWRIPASDYARGLLVDATGPVRFMTDGAESGPPPWVIAPMSTVSFTASVPLEARRSAMLRQLSVVPSEAVVSDPGAASSIGGEPGESRPPEHDWLRP